MEAIMEHKIKRYDTYKDSGVEWLEEIPEHWEVKKLRFIFNLGKGLTITKQNLINEGVFCVNYGEIHSKYGFDLDTDRDVLKCVNEEYLISDPKSLIKNGDFVFADTSEDIEGSGNFTHLRSNNEIFAGYHTVIARSKNNLLPLFFAFVFDSTSFRNQIRTRVKGVKVYSITQSLLKETTVWIPPLSEQTAIANFLDRKTALFDQAISIKQKQIELLKERRQILIHQAVTKGLNQDAQDLKIGRISNDENHPEIPKSSKSSSRPMKDSGVEWIGEIPEDWEVKRLKYVVSLVSDKMLSKGNPLNYIGMENIESWTGNYIATNSETEGLANYFKDGDILFGKLRPYLAKVFLAKEEGICTTEFLVYRNGNEIYNWYLHLLMLSFEFINLIDSSTYGSKMPRANSDFIGNQLIPIPPIKEQIEIADYIEKATTKIATAISLKEQEIEKLKEYKSTLINSAVTGKIKIV